MTSEHIKRAREEFQIPFFTTGAVGSHGSWQASQPAGANEESPCREAQAALEATRSPALKRARGEGLPARGVAVADALLYERCPPTRGVSVEVIRGDSGRHFVFTLMADVHWSWHARNTIYQTALPSSSCGTDPGCDLEEVVRAYTWLPYHGLPKSDPFPVNEELAEGAGSPTATTGHAREVSPTYYYTKSSTSRVPRPHEAPARDFVGPRTASLLVDCLLQCAAEEASIVEASGWAWLYRGKSLRSEEGRALLETQLLAACLVNDGFSSALETPPSPATLQICVFRKC